MPLFPRTFIYIYYLRRTRFAGQMVIWVVKKIRENAYVLLKAGLNTFNNFSPRFFKAKANMANVKRVFLSSENQPSGA